MIISMIDLFSDHQAITVDAASTNIIDLLATGIILGDAAGIVRDVGKGTPVPLLVQVTEAFATNTSVEVRVEVDDNSSFSSAKIVARSGAIPVASLVVGYKFAGLDWVPIGTNERYMRLYYDNAGSDATAGKIYAGIIAGHQTNG